MNFKKFNEMAELVGIVAIVTSLIMLIIEINSNSEATRAQVRQSTAEGIRQITLQFSADDKLRDLTLSDESYESLSRSDRDKIGAFSMAYIMTIEEAYFQWGDGYLDEELWLNRKNHGLWWLRQRRVREHWDDWQDRGWFTDQFMAAMNADLEAIQ